MNMYFYLQLKRVAKLLPFVTVLTFVLLAGFWSILQGVFMSLSESETNKRYTIAVTGDTDNEYLKMGMTAMQAFDESRFAVDFAEMSESDAKTALAKGTVSAYIIIPERFVEKALCGEIDPITFVTSAGVEGLNGLFKKEITSLVTDIVIASQKGSYGLADALTDNGLVDSVHTHLETISIDYTELIFRRSELYEVEELGLSDGLSATEYYICAIIIVLLTLVGLPFAIVYIKKDYAFHRLLLSRSYSAGTQIMLEYLAFLIVMLLQTAIILLMSMIAVNLIPTAMDLSFLGKIASDLVMKTLPVIVMVTAFNMMMFELADTIVSGLLLHFFTAVGLCYITGCLYPIYVFPDSIKTLALFLPTGIARSYLASAFTFDQAVGGLIGLVLYSVVFFAAAWMIRFYKITKVRG